MAERKGFFREIYLRLNRDAARQMEEDLQDALEAAGKAGGEEFEKAMQAGGNKAARALTRTLSDAYSKTIAEARVKLARGLIDQREFDRIKREATATFDKGLIAGMERLRSEGKLTDTQFARLAGRIKTMGKEGPKEVGRIERALGKIKGVALGVGTALAALFAVDRIRQFGASSIQAALEAEKSGQRLQAVWTANAGAVARTFEELQRFSKQLQRDTLFQSEEIELSMAQLLTYKSISGDTFERTIVLATDLSSVFGGLTQSTAALARALDDPIRGLGELRKAGFTFEDSVIAQVRALTEQGRLLEAQRIILGELEKEVGGVAKSMKSGWVGAIDNLKKSWGDLKEEIGAALLAAGDGPSVFDTLTTSVREFGAWVADNREDIAQFGRDLLTAAEAAIKLAGALAKPFVATFRVISDPVGAWERWTSQRRIDRMHAEDPTGMRGLDFQSTRERQQEWIRQQEAAGGLRNMLGEQFAPGSARTKTPAELKAEAERRKAQEEAQRRAAEAERQRQAAALAAEIAALGRAHSLRVLTGAEIARAIELEGEVSARLRDGTLALEDRITAAQQLQTLQRVTPGAPATGMADTLGVTGAPAHAPILTPIDDPRSDQWAEVKVRAEHWVEEIGPMMDGVAYGIAGSFQDMFEVLYEGFDNTADAAAAMARGVGGALLGGVAEYASTKVKENVALAIEETARAFAAFGTPLMGTHLKAAATHSLAATKWALLAGASGAGQSAVAGGGRGGLSGGIPTGARDPSGRLLEDRRGPEVHIYIDPLDPANPAYQRNVYAAQRYATDRYGEGAIVTVHPRTGVAR